MMKQKCKCGADKNVAYIYRKKGRIGEWVAIGHFCVTCGEFTPEKKIRLSESMKTKENLAKGERKRV